MPSASNFTASPFALPRIFATPLRLDARPFQSPILECWFIEGDRHPDCMPYGLTAWGNSLNPSIKRATAVHPGFRRTKPESPSRGEKADTPLSRLSILFAEQIHG